MNGPARLDLLIPLTRPHAPSQQAQDSFEDLLRRDESRPSGSAQGVQHAVPVEKTGTHAQDIAPSSEAPGEVPERVEQQEDDMPVTLDGNDHAAQLERLYAAHLAAGGYLSIRPSGSKGVAEATLHGSTSIDGFTAAARTGVAECDVPQVEAAPAAPTEATPAPAEFAVAAGSEHSASWSALAGRVVVAPNTPESGTTDAPLWLADMARMSTSSDGLVTLWIRDFGASRDELAGRVAQMRTRAREAGVEIRAVMVNGQTWDNENHGKGE